jgi:hypothetical protein
MERYCDNLYYYYYYYYYYITCKFHTLIDRRRHLDELSFLSLLSTVVQNSTFSFSKLRADISRDLTMFKVKICALLGCDAA